MSRGDQIRVNLECTVCARRNYSIKKNKRAVPANLMLRKFCSNCGEHTEHRMGK